MRKNLFWLSDEQWARIELHLPTEVRGVERKHDRRVISEIVHVLKSGCRWSGLVTGYGNRWTRKRVTSLRSHRRIPVYKSGEDRIEPWLNLSKAARFLRVAPKTLRLAAEDEQIWAIHSRMT